MDEKRLAELVRNAVLKEFGGVGETPDPTAIPTHEPAAERARPDLGASPEDVKLAKKVATWLGTEIPPLPWFGNWHKTGTRDAYLARTPARLGVGRAGVRYRTETILSFLTDHAAARDAVQSMIDQAVLDELGVVRLSSAASDKQEFLARPDLGRRLSDESAARVPQAGTRSPQVQIVIGDGLSAAAVNANLAQVLPPLVEGLRANGIKVGTPFAIDHCRVAAGDEVAHLLEAEVLCMLVGERPGLKTAESMGAYVTYLRVENFNEAMRSVISNIHKGGLPPATEGARQILELCLRALRDKKTGVEMS